MVNDEWSDAEALENAFRVADEELRKVERERDEWKARAEKCYGAWQKIAPARTVTREDVEKAIQGCAGWHPSAAEARMQAVARLADAVWHLVSGDDPAVYVVRESDISAVEVAHDERGWHARGATWSREPTAEGVRDGAKRYLRDVARYEALARAIEAGQDTDPLLDKARELAKAGGIDFDEQEPDGVEMLLSMARHVLGQEADQ